METIFIDDKPLTESERLTLVVYENAGSVSGMRAAMQKEKCSYVKVERGFKTFYVLRRKDINRLVVLL